MENTGACLDIFAAVTFRTNNSVNTYYILLFPVSARDALFFIIAAECGTSSRIQIRRRYGSEKELERVEIGAGAGGRGEEDGPMHPRTAGPCINMLAGAYIHHSTLRGSVRTRVPSCTSYTRPSTHARVIRRRPVRRCCVTHAHSRYVQFIQFIVCFHRIAVLHTQCHK